jgi:hypothetical protein
MYEFYYESFFFARAGDGAHPCKKLTMVVQDRVHEHCIATHLNLPNLKRPTYHIVNRQRPVENSGGYKDV